MMIHSFVLWYQRSACQHGAADKHGTPTHAPSRGDSASTHTREGLRQPSLAPLPPRPRCRHSADRPSARPAAEPPPSKPSWEGLRAPAAGGRGGGRGCPERSQQTHPCRGSGRSQATLEPADPGDPAHALPSQGHPSGRGQAPLCTHAWPWGPSLLGGPLHREAGSVFTCRDPRPSD